jgi:hypothetical protein
MDILHIACEGLRVKSIARKNLSSVLPIIQYSGRDGGARVVSEKLE